MRETNVKQILTQHINSIDDNIDCTSDIMESINTRSKGSLFSLNLKRPLVVVLILLLVSTVAYAATSEILKLKNDVGDDIASIQIDETNKNFHLESHIENRDLYSYPVDKELQNGTVIVIDTSNPDRYNTRYYQKPFISYNEFDMTIDQEILPEKLSNFEFSRAYVYHGYIMPTKEKRSELASQHSDKEFVIYPLEEVNKIERIQYEYKKTGTDEKYFVMIDYINKGSFHELSNMVNNYKIVDIGTVEAFLIERDNNVVRYSSNGATSSVEFENDYFLNWYEPEFGFAAYCSPHANNVKDNQAYPDDTDESLLQLGTEINRVLNRK